MGEAGPHCHALLPAAPSLPLPTSSRSTFGVGSDVTASERPLLTTLP